MFSSNISGVRSNNSSARPTTAGNRTTPGSSITGRTVSSSSTGSTATLQHRPAPSTDDTRSKATSFNNLDYASQQKIMRAIHVLGNSGLLMKYALENDISIPQARHYFEQVAGGGDPKPIIKKWFPF